jgi:hypothetical protein
MLAQGEFIYDLMNALRRDPQRAAKVSAALQRMDTVTAAVADGKATRSDIAKIEAEIVPLCGFNFGLLIPRFFPRYPFEKPLDLSARPFMYAMTALAPGSVVTLKAGRQVGKCADGDTTVVTDRGVATLHDIFAEGIPVQASIVR